MNYDCDCGTMLGDWQVIDPTNNELLDLAVGVHEPVSFTTVGLRHECPWAAAMGLSDLLNDVLLPVNVALVGSPVRTVWMHCRCGLCGLDVAALVEIER